MGVMVLDVVMWWSGGDDAVPWAGNGQVPWSTAKQTLQLCVPARPKTACPFRVARVHRVAPS